MAGVSRSVSLVIAYLLKYQKMDFDDALALLKNRRSIVNSSFMQSNPNEGFVTQLKQYE